jgi:3-hydroxybutyryl-CoA dehydratase
MTITSETTALPEFAVGDVISGPTRPISLQRAGWYSIGIFSAATGAPHEIQENIHTSHEYARTQGLPGAIADGMHSTNWLNALLGAEFGAHYILRGRLRTKYIKPTLIDVPITPKAQVTSRVVEEAGTRYELDVWIEDADGVKLTVGDASVVVAG